MRGGDVVLIGFKNAIIRVGVEYDTFVTKPNRHTIGTNTKISHHLFPFYLEH